MEVSYYGAKGGFLSGFSTDHEPSFSPSPWSPMCSPVERYWS